MSSAYQQNCQNLTNNGKKACNMLVAVTLYGSIWAWNADTGQTIFSRAALWNDCGPGSSIATSTDGGAGSLPAAGIVSTPVIDPTLSPPAMFLTSLCASSSGTPSWYLHEVDLTTGGYDVCVGGTYGTGGTCVGGTAQDIPISSTTAAYDGADDESNGTAPFVSAEVLQRSALLETPAASGTPPIVYFSFGSAVPEGYAVNANGVLSYWKYHGWVFGYPLGAGGALGAPYSFDPTPTGYNAVGTPPCSQNCATPGSTSCVPSGYQNSPNWCGHGGGAWMSGRGMAADTISSVSHAFLGIGNGAFQNGNGSANNWGQSIVDFQSTSPGQPSSSNYFTAHGGSALAVAPTLGTYTCPNEPGNTCKYTVEVQNENDWDMSVGGILLFQGPTGGNWLVTVDKAGYGYLLDQTALGGFAPNDTGNLFPFGAVSQLCPSLGFGAAANCHRITNLALYSNAGAGTYTLYYWPYNEILTGIQFSYNEASNAGNGTIQSTGTTVALTSACTFRSSSAPCFTDQLVVGDVLVAGSQSQTVTAIDPAGASITVSPGFSPNVNTATWSYSGYFVNPVYDNKPTTGSPVDLNVGYAGGAVEVTSNGGNTGSALVWGLATLPTSNSPNGAGVLNAYNTALNLQWSSNNSAFDPTFTVVYPPFNCPGITGGCASLAATFAMPTIAKGSVYIPTFGISYTSKNSSCTSTSPCSGLVVYCGPGTTACNGSWQ